jgi:hypothetical protein
MVRPDRFELPAFWFVASGQIASLYIFQRLYSPLPVVATRVLARKWRVKWRVLVELWIIQVRRFTVEGVFTFENAILIGE